MDKGHWLHGLDSLEEHDCSDVSLVTGTMVVIDLTAYYIKLDGRKEICSLGLLDTLDLLLDLILDARCQILYWLFCLVTTARFCSIVRVQEFCVLYSVSIFDH